VIGVNCVSICKKKTGQDTESLATQMNATGKEALAFLEEHEALFSSKKVPKFQKANRTIIN
jgi:hypothetical protein